MPPKVSQWFLTYPKCDATKEQALEFIKTIDTVIHYVIAQEQHKDGDNHLHVYVKYVDGVETRKAPKVFDLGNHHGNYQPVRSCKAVTAYVSKDDKNYLSNFDLKTYQQKKGKLLVGTIRDKTAKQALIDDDISFMQVRAYQTARALLEEPYEHDDHRGVWIFGPEQVGKSRLVRAHVKATGMRMFDKPQNKWWDGYDGEELVLMDDFDQKGDWADHYLKRWTDRYACSGEIKGGKVQLRHKVFMITSNFSIAEIFKALPEVTIRAIEKRFKVIYIKDKDSVPDHTTLLRNPNQVLVTLKKPAQLARRKTPPGDNRMTFTEMECFDDTNLRKKNKICIEPKI